MGGLDGLAEALRERVQKAVVLAAAILAVLACVAWLGLLVWLSWLVAGWVGPAALALTLLIAYSFAKAAGDGDPER